MRGRKTVEKEIKISLPSYKIGYALCVVVFLALVRGVGSTSEIGPALEPYLAMLSVVFCGDTYVREVISRRFELWHLFSVKRRFVSLMERMAIQELFLLCLAVLGYLVSFWFQKPMSLYGVSMEPEKEAYLFLMYLLAIGVTLVFWGMFSFTTSCVFRNMWAGIGCSVVLWVMTYSQAGDKFLGKWNLFSYTFSDIGDMGNLDFWCGKLLCICMSFVMIILLPVVIEKRG